MSLHVVVFVHDKEQKRCFYFEQPVIICSDLWGLYVYFDLSHKSKHTWNKSWEEFEDTKGVIEEGQASQYCHGWKQVTASPVATSGSNFCPVGAPHTFCVFPYFYKQLHIYASGLYWEWQPSSISTGTWCRIVDFTKKIRGGKWKLKWHFNIKCRNSTRTATDSWTRNISCSTGQFTRLVRRIDDISVSLDIFIFYHTIVIYMLDTKPLSYDMSIDPLMITAVLHSSGTFVSRKLWRHKCI